MASTTIPTVTTEPITCADADDDSNTNLLGANATSTNQYYLDALDDVHTRFILNLPDSELSTSDRLFFQLEQAWWYYEDWICDVYPERNLPRYPSFKLFAKMMFEYSIILPSSNLFYTMWNEFTNYKRSISNYGCILLTADCTEMILCQLYNSRTLTYPAGKINHGEDGPTAAARETYEETGFDPFCLRGLTSIWKEQYPEKITWNVSFASDSSSDSNNNNMLVYQEENSSNSNNTESGTTNATPGKNQHGSSMMMGGGKRRICYVIVGVPKDFPFAPVCRKEVSDISWYPVNGTIPKPSFGVIPFLPKLKKYIHKLQQKKPSVSDNDNIDNSSRNNKKTPNKSRGRNNSRSRNNNTMTEPNVSSNNTNTNTNTNKKDNNSRGRGKKDSRGRDSRGRDSRGRTHRIDSIDDDLVISGLAQTGDDAGWSVEEMFKVNEKLIGHKSTYDGNPYIFAEQGFHNGIDPHSYRIVGGSLLNQSHDEDTNTSGIDNVNNNISIDPVRSLHADSSSHPATSRLQALFQNNNNVNDIPKVNKNESDHDENALKPFFSMDGATPWGQIVEAIIPTLEPAPKIIEATAVQPVITSIKKKQQPKQEEKKNKPKHKKGVNKNWSGSYASSDDVDNNNQYDHPDNDDDIFLTDVQITERNKAKTAAMTQFNSNVLTDQEEKTHTPEQTIIITTTTTTTVTQQIDQQWQLYQQQRKQKMDDIITRRRLRNEQYERDMEYIRNWVQKLPKPQPTKYFGTFQLDADNIMMIAEQEIMKGK